MTLNITADVMEQLTGLAKRAGVEIMKIYNTDFDVEAKADASPVTEADGLAEALITRTILEEISDAYPIVGEEAFSAGDIPDVEGGPFWLVDPLDGTKEFIKRNDEFTVNIALIENNRPALGVVHAPAIDATYWGSVNGAFAETRGSQARTIACRAAAGDGVVVVASRSHRTPEVDQYLANFQVKKEASAGSSLKFCLVAEGRADLYPRMGPTMEWDTAAGHAVVRFAGGTVTTVEGDELTYGKGGFKNPFFIVKGA